MRDRLEHEATLILGMDHLHRRPVTSQAGRLLINDTLAHHTKCRIEELAYLKDHTLNRCVGAHNVVTSYVDRADPCRVYLNSEPPTNERMTDTTEREARVGSNEVLGRSAFAICRASSTIRRNHSSSG